MYLERRVGVHDPGHEGCGEHGAGFLAPSGVVIENQLEQSDDSHCLRLLGYAATAEAYILVWVAQHFTTYHRSILNWVNEADTIDVYAVTVHRVKDNARGRPTASHHALTPAGLLRRKPLA